MTVNVCNCEIQLRCEPTVVNRLLQLCPSLRNALLFRGLLYWSRTILVTFSLYLSVISLIPSVQLFTHSLHSLPTITCSPPEFLIMNKPTKICCRVLSQFSPIPFHCLTVQYHVPEHPKPMHLAHTVYCWIRISCRLSLISPSLTLDGIFNINCVFGPKNTEIPEITLSA